MFKWFIANVEDPSSDPAQSGSVKINIEGYQGSTQEFRHAKPMFGVNNPINDKVGGPVTGLTKGSRVICAYLDQEGQVPIIIGTIGAESKKDKNGNKDYTGGDTPPSHKDEQNKEGEKLGGGDYRYIPPEDGDYLDTEKGKIDNKNILEYANTEAKNATNSSTWTNIPCKMSNSGGSIGQCETA